MARPKGVTNKNVQKIVNDQGEIIELLKNKKFNAVWEKVKFVGYAQIVDINTRFLLFKKACDSFRPEENNNFIHYYKNSLHYYNKSLMSRDTNMLSNNNVIVSHLLRHKCSPEEYLEPLVRELEQFEL